MNVCDNRLPRAEAVALVARRIDRSDLRHAKAQLGLRPRAKLSGCFELVVLAKTMRSLYGGSDYQVRQWGVKVNGHPAAYISTSYDGTRHKLLPCGYGGGAQESQED